MKNKKQIFIFFILFFFSVQSYLYAGTLKTENIKGKAAVSYLSGSAILIKQKGITLKKTKKLKKGSFLFAGDKIKTGKNSKIEIFLPDKSYIRFAEQTIFEMESAYFNEISNTRDISITLVLGNAWAKVSTLFDFNGRFEINTKTAVAGVRGTTYRINVYKDTSAIIKVYKGEVEVKGKKSSINSQKADSPLKASGPYKISGPHKVEGPKAVSLDEWVHIVKSFQEIIIGSDGSVTKPFRFSPVSDTNSWVEWNNLRDK